MQFDPGFFEREDVAAIGGEFGIIGEITVIKLLCAVHKAGYYLMWTHRSKMAFMRSVQGLTPELLDRIVERLAEYGFFSRQKLKKDGVLTSADIQWQHLKRMGLARARRQTEWPYLLVDLVDSGVVPAVRDVNGPDEPCGVPLSIDPHKPRDSQKYLKIRIPSADSSLYLYRRVPNPDYRAPSSATVGNVSEARFRI